MLQSIISNVRYKFLGSKRNHPHPIEREKSTLSLTEKHTKEIIIQKNKKKTNREILAF